MTEDTLEHRDLFGSEGEGTLYWKTPEELVEQVGKIVREEVDPRTLAEKLHQRITREQRHRYTDRLRQIAAWSGLETTSE